MVRKTITIKDEILYNLELNHIVSQYNSFSELVSTALQVLIEKEKKEQYKKAMIEASKDKIYRQDMEEIDDDFKYID